MSFADVFQRYISNPALCKDITVYDDDKVLIIKDAFPKALRHYLVIPKSQTITKTHPITALSDIKVHDQLKDYVELTKQLIVENLASCGLISSSIHEMNSFKQEFIKSGVHSIPSLNNVHIHVITRDFNSPRLKNKKHYNSFNTLFFVDFDSFHGTEDNDNSDRDTIYSTDSEEVDPVQMSSIIKDTPLACSYCGQEFGNKMVQLKSHLAEEFRSKFDVSKDCRPNQMGQV